MRREDCFQLGHISRLHGYKGQLIAVFDTDRKEAYTELESVLIEIDHELIPFFITNIAQNSKGHFILGFEDISDSAAAEKLLGAELFLPLSFLPPLSGKSFYFHEIIGFKIIDQQAGEIGICEDVVDATAQALLQVEYQGRSLLLPAVDDFIVEINRSSKEIIMDLPEGILAL